jgi:CopG family transcriptional regulator, nickel-responsive regulator
MVVISVSLPSKELKEFDSITEKMGFSSRSDAVRDAFQNFISENRWKDMGEGSINLLVSLIYEDCKAHKVLDIIHNHSKTIHSSSHTHVDHKCIDQLVLNGEIDQLKDFLNNIAGIKDVRMKRVHL